MIATLTTTTSSASAYNDYFSMTLGALGLALPCFAFAWEGLVRRQLLMPAFPPSAVFGSQALLIRRLGGLAIGLVCLLASVFLVLFALLLIQVGAGRDCRGHGALACLGTLAGTAEWTAWAWFGGFVLWFVIVWLRMGDPRKRVLVYGVWYHQEKVARQINHELRARGLASLPQERLYTLEDSVLRVMRAKGWLVYGDAWLAGGRQQQAAPVDVTPETMWREALREPAFESLDETERVAVGLPLALFQTQAERAQHLSPLRRWWVGTGQHGKLGSTVAARSDATFG